MPARLRALDLNDPAQNAIAKSISDQATQEGRGAPAFGSPKTKYFELWARAVPQTIFSTGQQTLIWGFGGSPNSITYPGPTLTAQIGETVVMRVNNMINNRVVVHHHGGHNPPDSDGYPNQYVLSGSSRCFVYTNSSTRSATLWYHDHTDAGNTGDEGTGHNVYFGLAGFYLLGDDFEANARKAGTLLLPQEPYDLPQVFQDRLFNNDNSLNYPPFNHDGVIGDTFLVNGAIQPHVHVEPRHYRLRLLNGCNARVIQLFLNPAQGFVQIASDGGLLPRAFPTTSVRLAPGERAEIVVDFSKMTKGTLVTLRNCMAQTDGRKPDGLVPLNAGVDFLQFIVDQALSTIPDDTFIPGPQQDLRPLGPDEPGSEKDAVHTRDVILERGHGVWLLNDKIFEPGRIDFAPQARFGDTEIWRFTNGGGGWVHPMHIHLEAFRILDRNGVPPGPEEAGLKDMAYTQEGETVRVLVKFHQQPAQFLLDNGARSGFWAFHCHNLEHEDMHMMGTFGVTE